MRFLGSMLAALAAIGLVSAQNCQLIVPANMLTATGLATPYQLQNIPGDTAATPCDEANAGVAAFVQGAVINLDTGVVQVYNPLVINAGTTAKITPTPPVLPTNNVVGLWFGFNGAILQLVDPAAAPGTLAAANCVNGFGGTFFGEYSYCNAVNWFDAANNAILNGTLTVPPIGTASDGKPCPTVRDFAIVDMDSSDNVLTDYLMVPNPAAAGTMLFAQNTPTNQLALGTTNIQANASDNRLVALLIDAAIGCTPWKVQDLAEVNQISMVAALPLNELQAAYMQAPPQALVGSNHVMTLILGAASVDKINLYRAGVNQPMINNPAVDANGLSFCQNLVATAFTRLNSLKTKLQAAASPDPANTNNLFDFLVLTRLAGSLQGNGGLNCVGLGVANPFTAAAAAQNGGLLGGMNATLIMVLAITGGAIVLIGVGAAIFIVVQRRNAAATAANNFMAL